ncbi:MAG: Ig-like domain-containing protein [Lachnospiraceae bacterium]|nr:Ig-like domain-containing protein [Lachnospiraceae bacterium]
MRFKRKLAAILIFALVLTCIPLDGLKAVKAAEDAAGSEYPYGFFDNEKVDAFGGLYELKKSSMQLTLKTIKGNSMGSNVKIIFFSQSLENNPVVQVGATGEINDKGESREATVTFIRKGPGFHTISGAIREYATPGAISAGAVEYQDYTFSFQVKVPLKIDRTSNIPTGDYEQLPAPPRDTDGFYKRKASDLEEGYTLFLKYPGISHQIHIVGYDIVTGGATKYNYSTSSLDWKMTTKDVSVDDSVATVSDDGSGVVTAVGAGLSTLNIETTVGDTKQSAKVDVVVPLKVSFAPPANATEPSVKYAGFKSADEASGDTMLSATTASDGSISVYTTAFNPLEDVTWEIQNTAKGETNKDVSDWFDISSTSMGDPTTNHEYSRIDIKCAKAGTYKFTGYMKNLDKALSKERVEFKITVPVSYSEKDVWMNVGDKYSMYNNTNIPKASDYTYVSSNPSVASVNSSTGIIKARKYGTATIYAWERALGYADYEAAVAAGKALKCNVHVVDTLALSTEEAEIAVGGTLTLVAQTTDITRPITWTIEEGGEKTVSIDDDGSVSCLVTGLKAGEAVVTASQTIDGVEKSVSCNIKVVADITKLVITPAEVELNIDEYAVLKATPTPKLSAGLVLHWVSSDPSIVEIENPEEKSSTCSIHAMSPGSAAILAVNQNNMVVGSAMVTVLRAPDNIKLSENTVSVAFSAKQYQLRAIISPDTATNQKVVWKSSNPKIATVDDNGLVTFIKHGTVTIIAQSDADATLQDMCEMTIREAVSSLTLDDTSVTLTVGSTKRLSYEVLPETAYDRSVTFVSMDTKVATVNSTGLITAKKPGTTYITITTNDGGLSKVCTVTVKQEATVLKLDATALVLDVGESYALEATFTPKTVTESKLTWASNDNKVAKVDAKGRVTATGEGDCIISCTTTNNITVFCYVKVRQPVTGVEIEDERITIDKGEEYQLTANVLPDNASNTNVIWESENTEIATVDEDGVVTGRQGGATLITATTEEGGMKAVCLVTVKEKIVSLKMNKSTYKLGLGKKYQLEATSSNKTATDQTYTWVSSDPDICSVNQSGIIKGLKLGYATITAYANDGSDAEAACEVRVINQATNITLNTSVMNMIVGDNRTLKATLKPSNVTYKKPKFTSDNTAVAIVDTDGKVTAVGAGTCNITARPKDNSGLKAVCVVMVRNAVPATGLTLSQTEVTLGVGAKETITYSIKPVDSTDKVTWSTNNKNIASVGKSNGVITAKAPGVAVVTAKTTSGKTAQVKVTVVGLNYSRLELEQYDSYRLRVEGVTSGIIWDVDDPDICTVTGGLVKAKKAGTTYVVARVSGTELRCRVRVTDITR